MHAISFVNVFILTFGLLPLSADSLHHNFSGPELAQLDGASPRNNSFSAAGWVASTETSPSYLRADGSAFDEPGDSDNVDRGAFIDLGAGFFLAGETYHLTIDFGALNGAAVFAGFTNVATPDPSSTSQIQGSANLAIRARDFGTNDAVAIWNRVGTTNNVTGVNTATDDFDAPSHAASMTIETNNLSDATVTVRYGDDSQSISGVDISTLRHFYIGVEDAETAAAQGLLAKFNSVSFARTSSPEPLLVHQWTFDAPSRRGESFGALPAPGRESTPPPGYAAGFAGNTSSLSIGSAIDQQINVARELIWPGFDKPGNDFSIAFWLKRESVDTDADGIFDADASAAGTIEPGFQALFVNDNLLLAFSDGVNREVSTSSFAITDSSWHHFALVADRDDTTGALSVDAFLDGVFVETYSFPNVTGSIAPVKELELGAISNSASFGLEGRLDDFRIYAGLIDSARILELATPPPAVNFSSLELSGTDFNLEWETGEGRIYFIESSPDLLDWSPVTNSETSGDGTPANFAADGSPARNFFRLRLR